MRTWGIVAGVGALAVAGTLAVATPGGAQSYPPCGGPGYGMYGYGPGMMYGYGYGPGMMYGYGYGAGGYRGAVPNGSLSVDDVKQNFERWLSYRANPRVKLGNVAAKDADTITVDVVTTDGGAVVERYEVDRHTGFMRPAE